MRMLVHTILHVLLSVVREYVEDVRRISGWSGPIPDEYVHIFDIA